MNVPKCLTCSTMIFLFFSSLFGVVVVVSLTLHPHWLKKMWRSGPCFNEFDVIA